MSQATRIPIYSKREFKIRMAVEKAACITKGLAIAGAGIFVVLATAILGYSAVYGAYLAIAANVCGS